MPKLKDLTKPRTRVAIILDRSGSMYSIAKYAVDTYNEQLQTLRKNIEDQDITITLVQFDNEIDFHCFNEPLEITKDLKYEDYKPGASTALNDAIGMTVHKFKTLNDWKDSDISYLILVITDGYENSSKEFSKKSINKITEELEKKQGNWTFTYLGANTDLNQVAKDYGFDTSNTQSFVSSKIGVARASSITSGSLSSYFKGRSQGLSRVSNFYETKDDKK